MRIVWNEKTSEDCKKGLILFAFSKREIGRL